MKLYSDITYMAVVLALYGVVALKAQVITQPPIVQPPRVQLPVIVNPRTLGITDTLLFTPNPNKSGIINLSHLGETVKRHENVELNENLLLGKDTSMYTLLFGKIILINKQNKSLSPKSELFTWWGTIQGDPNSYVIFARSGKVYSANIWWKETLYQLAFVGNDLYEIREIDQNAYPRGDGEQPISPKILTPNSAQTFCSNTDSAPIDVMVLYTDDVLVAAGNEDIIKSEIYLTVHLTNLAYLESDVDQRIALVHTSKLDFNESGDAPTDWNTLKSLASVRTLRDNYSADIVALIVNISNMFGRAMPMDVIALSAEADAYAVVQRESSAGIYSFAHELAHLMGCGHICISTKKPKIGSYYYAHGFGYTDAQNIYKGTIMSCNNCTFLSAKESRLLFFSNPNVLYNGTPLGLYDPNDPNTCQADNHRVLNQTALTVANFRCHSSLTPNVWMKDTWDDVGQEPYPAIPNEVTWNSPDIWVRNIQDTNLTHIHDHENLKLGVSNWVYVKLHNGGSTSNGTLELYYADASLNQKWPNSWTKLKDTTVTMNAGTSRIVEYRWDVPSSQNVDYTLLARWVSVSDPMAVAETTDVAVNVVNNNNISWKNTKIVSVNADSETNVEMKFTSNPGTYLEINFDDTFPRQSFAEKGLVLIRFDRRTSLSKVTGSGFDKISNNLFLATASKIRFDNLSMGKTIKGMITLSFKSKKTTPRQKYYCSLSRLEANQKSKKVSAINGVDYVINLSN